jgi:hypothetical protein
VLAGETILATFAGYAGHAGHAGDAGQRRGPAGH